MEINFPDCLDEGETLRKFLDAAAVGKGKTKRARTYVRPIAVRYVERHAQVQLELQIARRQPAAAATTVAIALEPATTVPASGTPAPDTSSNDVFVDVEWSKELQDIEVQELDGTWRGVTMFRHTVDQARVCLWFGKDEYEGIVPDHPYGYCPRTEILVDDEGYEINWRVKGLENDDYDDDEDDGVDDY